MREPIPIKEINHALATLYDLLLRKLGDMPNNGSKKGKGLGHNNPYSINFSFRGEKFRLNFLVHDHIRPEINKTFVKGGFLKLFGKDRVFMEFKVHFMLFYLGPSEKWLGELRKKEGMVNSVQNKFEIRSLKEGITFSNIRYNMAAAQAKNKADIAWFLSGEIEIPREIKKEIKTIELITRIADSTKSVVDSFLVGVDEYIDNN